MSTNIFPIEIAGLVLGGLLVAAWVWRRPGAAAGPERAKQALASAARLVAMVAEVQQHRGMSGAWLAGDESFAARMPGKQAAIDRCFVGLLEDAAREDGERHPCFTSNDVKLLRHRWRELAGGLSSSTPERSFQAHCRIVATLLEWLGALGEARIEQPFGSLIPAHAGRNFAHRLPALAECLGQARALGSAVAARRQCPPVSRVRLLFLVSRAEFLLGQALGGDGHGPPKSVARGAVANFVEAVRHRLLADEVTISASDCFSLGTRAVDGVFGWIEHERRSLEAALPGAVQAAPRAGAAERGA